MPSYVFVCETCQHEIRHLTTAPINTAFTESCPKCKDIRRFLFLREGNIGEDWYSRILIKNKRRRPGDELYRTDDTPREGGNQDDVQIPA